MCRSEDTSIIPPRISRVPFRTDHNSSKDIYPEWLGKGAASSRVCRMGELQAHEGRHTEKLHEAPQFTGQGLAISGCEAGKPDYGLSPETARGPPVLDDVMIHAATH